MSASQYPTAIDTVAIAQVLPLTAPQPKVLDIAAPGGGSTRLVRALLPQAACTVLRHGAAASGRERVDLGGIASFTVEAMQADLAQPLPFEDEAFDAVFALDVLDRADIDPLALVREISRVLKTGGAFVATAANAVSLGRLYRVLAGLPPFPAGTAIRAYGPRDLEALCICAGCATRTLTTPGAAAGEIDARNALASLGPVDPTMRGEAILWTGLKESWRPEGRPVRAFPYSAEFALTGRVEAGAVEIEVANRGTHPWDSAADCPVLVGVRLLDSAGRLIADNGRLALPPVPPGGVARFLLPVGTPAEPPDAFLALDMVHEMKAWFLFGGGETGTLTVPAERAAFDRLATIGTLQDDRVVYDPPVYRPEG